jgi:hypothetical protein
MGYNFVIVGEDEFEKRIRHTGSSNPVTLFRLTCSYSGYRLPALFFAQERILHSYATTYRPRSTRLSNP